MSGFTETVSSVGIGGQVSESVLLELADLPELGCESVTHGVPGMEGFHSDGPATHYAQVRHDCNGPHPKGAVYSVCQRLADTIRAREAGGLKVNCLQCWGHFEDATEWVVIIGTVKGRGKKK